MTGYCSVVRRYQEDRKAGKLKLSDAQIAGTLLLVYFCNWHLAPVSSAALIMGYHIKRQKIEIDIGQLLDFEECVKYWSKDESVQCRLFQLSLHPDTIIHCLNNDLSDFLGFRSFEFYCKCRQSNCTSYHEKYNGQQISMQEAKLEPMAIVKNKNRVSNITCPVDHVSFSELHEVCSNIYINSQKAASEQFVQNKGDISQGEDGSVLTILQPVQMPWNTGAGIEVLLGNYGQDEDGREAEQVDRVIDEPYDEWLNEWHMEDFCNDTLSEENGVISIHGAPASYSVECEDISDMSDNELDYEMLCGATLDDSFDT